MYVMYKLRQVLAITTFWAVVLSVHTATAATAEVPCGAQAYITAEAKVRGAALRKEISPLFDKFITYRNATEEEKRKLFALAIEYWQLMGRDALIDDKEVATALFAVMRKGPQGYPTNEYLSGIFKTYAKALAEEIQRRYIATHGPATYDREPRPVPFPAQIPYFPPISAAAWAQQYSGFHRQPGDIRAQRHYKYCMTLGKVRNGAELPLYEEQAAVTFEREYTGFVGDGLPPAWEKAKAAGAQIIAKREEERRIAVERAAKEAKVIAFEQKQAADIAERARRDEYLAANEVDLLCRYHSDLCMRARAILRYSECMGEAANRAAQEYAGAYRAGMKPTDGTWSGTFSALQSDYEAGCQSLRPPNYYH